MKISVVGLGYVGLPLAIQFARAKIHVLGIDIDPTKVDSINQGRSYIRHIAPTTILEMVKEKRLYASTDFARIKEVDAVVICVPTPLTKNREPDVSFILKTGRAIAAHLAKGTLVVLESRYPTAPAECRSAPSAARSTDSCGSFAGAFISIPPAAFRVPALAGSFPGDRNGPTEVGTLNARWQKVRVTGVAS